MVQLKPNERIDQLQAGGIEIIQSKDVFAFSLDAVLLADFAQVHANSRVVDLAAGNGAVSLFVARKTKKQVTMIELQPKLADMAQRSITLNQLEDHVDCYCMDLKDTAQVVPKDSVDVVTCNPPYFKTAPASSKNPNPYLAVARHELTTDFQTVAQTAAGLLKYQGKAFFVHRPDRLGELLATLTANHLAPKRLRFIHPYAQKEANMVLIEAIRAGKPDGIRILPPLIVYSGQGVYTPAVEHLLHG